MGEARRRKKLQHDGESDRATVHDGIDLHVLPPIAQIGPSRIRALTDGNMPSIKETAGIILNAFRAVVGGLQFHVGFCIGDGESFSAIGIAVIERLMVEVPDAPIHVVPIVHEEIAWDVVLRHLRNFDERVLVFAFRDADVYDAGIGPTHYVSDVRVFNHEGHQLKRLSESDLHRIAAQKAKILNRPPPSLFALGDSSALQDVPWIFRFQTPTGKVLRLGVWDGRRDYHHMPPTDIATWVGGKKVAIVQVDSPVGVNRRSSLLLSNTLAQDFDGIVHWARDSETFQSILSSFIRLDLESLGKPELSDDHDPEVIIFAANG